MARDSGDNGKLTSGVQPSSHSKTTMESAESETFAASTLNAINTQESPESDSDTLMEVTQNDLYAACASSSSGSGRIKVQWPRFCTIDKDDKEVFYFTAVPRKPKVKGVSEKRRLFLLTLFENIYEYMLQIKDPGQPPRPSSSGTPKSRLNAAAPKSARRENTASNHNGSTESTDVEFIEKFDGMQIDSDDDTPAVLPERQ